ncbi:ATP-binding protein [Rufibacter hautae]|uniref:ATP-binding protein n=1 Tax=Rufibacter hautae TaxID=2595005 RepID=A0A5B6TEY5_9BACT|nr:ATP-binding protein [Rufibacter hautae]KAA3438746.1 ATP-binding protein [Rufibacter hautae]
MGFHQQLLEYTSLVIDHRLRHFTGASEGEPLFDRTYLRALLQEDGFGRVFKKVALNDEELLIVLLALAPHLNPGFYSNIILNFLPDGGDFPEFGGVKGTNHRGILPTGETALFVLAGENVEQRLKVQDLLSYSGRLQQNGFLQVETVKTGEPTMSGRLLLDEEVVEQLTLGKVTPPRFSGEFAAELLTTEQEWPDLILNHHTRSQIEDILTWLQHNDTLLNTWGMRKKIKPGYRTLFYGPPGTGKTLTATLLGKHTHLDVYRIDLSQLVSKYIGETEKNLARIFDKAQHKKWILFFDEADALFGKRTNQRDAQDRYANQEVAYLLQRIEGYPGVVVLASNMKSNIDEAFLRRFHSIIHFPKPTAAERLLLWQNALPKQLKVGKQVALESLAQKYELTGSGIINVVQRVCLEALAQKTTSVPVESFVTQIKKEMEKEGKMV